MRAFSLFNAHVSSLGNLCWYPSSKAWANGLLPGPGPRRPTLPYPIVPLVLGTPPDSRGSGVSAARMARANALKMASAL